ncbi:unnamed protein product, partial [Musa acuminata subsp. burmannicoides]
RSGRRDRSRRRRSRPAPTHRSGQAPSAAAGPWGPATPPSRFGRGRGRVRPRKHGEKLGCAIAIDCEARMRTQGR